MKRSLIALIWTLLLSLLTSPAVGQDLGCPATPIGDSWCGYYSTTQADARQKFLDDTVQLRRALVAKQAEYNALKARPNPDPKLASKLAKEIFDIQEQLRTKARTYGIIKGGPAKDDRGRGRHPMGGAGFGWYCW